MGVRLLVRGEKADLVKKLEELHDEIAKLNRNIRSAEREESLVTEKRDLEEQIERLKITKAREEELRDKRERELTHMIGLEQKRQEFEVSATKRETTLEVREANLLADQKRFEEQMKFNTDRFEAQVSYLKDLLEEIMKRLPTVELGGNLVLASNSNKNGPNGDGD